ncbi:hypothetical protein CAPTEDRAFT_142359, partial [Capitella teleta]
MVEVCQGNAVLCGICICRIKHVDCSGLELQSVPRNSYSSDTETLNLSNNNIIEIKEHDFDTYPAMKFLFLDHNQLRTIHNKALLSLRNLTYLDLSRNDLNIQVLEKSVF